MEWLVFQSLGGLGLFIFGMKIMSEGLQKVAGKKMRKILGLVSNNRFVGCAVGSLVTSVIQSSSATTVMLVSFVDAGLMTLVQATSVILGANVGTTVTAQLIAFRIEAFALPAIATGVFLKFFVGRRRWGYLGDALLGFGLVFFGLSTMKLGFAPVKQDPAFISFFTQFSADHLSGLFLCVLIGTTMTMILQSSSATVGVTMALASQGLLDFPTSVALVLGDNIGTTITAELASIGAGLSAKQTARAHTLFNVIGVIYIICFFPLFIDLVVWVTSSLMKMGPPDVFIGAERPYMARYIANAHTLFNMINAFFFLCFLKYLSRLAVWLTPHPKDERDLDELHHIKFIDFKYIDTPTAALGQARAEIVRMGESVQVMYSEVIKSLKERKLKDLPKWRKLEDAIDDLHMEITEFLVRVMQGSSTAEDSGEVASLMRLANNLERNGDAIQNIIDMIEQMVDQNLYFSGWALHDYDLISDEVRRFLALVVEAIRNEEQDIMAEAHEIRDKITRMREEMKTDHILRLKNGLCDTDAGVVLADLLVTFEKMGDFCYYIAQAISGLKS